MYEQIKEEFLVSSQSEAVNSVVASTQDREKFLDSFLSEYLNEEKSREKNSLKERLKYKHHQLEVAAKHARKELKKKRDADALAAGLTVASRNKQQKKLVLSAKLKKKLKMYKLNKEEKLDFKKYEQINSLWNAYANSCLLSCLGPPGNERLQEESVLNCLKQLDYHGCYLKVTKSKSKCLIGVEGIVLQDKKNVFYILNKQNKVKIVPKPDSLFEFELLNFCKMTLVGSNICHKPEMRTTKHAKIKTRSI